MLWQGSCLAFNIFLQKLNHEPSGTAPTLKIVHGAFWAQAFAPDPIDDKRETPWSEACPAHSSAMKGNIQLLNKYHKKKCSIQFLHTTCYTTQ